MSVGSQRSAGYGETSGYGVSRYVDCNSALALLGFILFVDILRDIIEDVTTPMEEEEGGEGRSLRRRRWAGRGVSALEPDILTFVSQGGADHLYDALPGLLPLLTEGLWQGEGSECAQRRVCEINRVLAKDYGAPGRIFGTLISNVVGRASTSEESAMLQAARTGRRYDQSCASAFAACNTFEHNTSLAAPHLLQDLHPPNGLLVEASTPP